MAALVVVERHLWLKLSVIKERDRMFLLDEEPPPAFWPLQRFSLVIESFQEGRRQSKGLFASRGPPQRAWGVEAALPPEAF